MPRSKRDTVRARTPSAPSPESPLLNKRKVFAQRKFAQGVTTPYAGSAPPSPPAPCSRPVSPVTLPPDGPLPKTEDFITFLCFRGTETGVDVEGYGRPWLERGWGEACLLSILDCGNVLKVVCHLPTNSNDIFPRIGSHCFHLWTQPECCPNLK